MHSAAGMRSRASTIVARTPAAAVLTAALATACATRPRPLDDSDRWGSNDCRARFTLEHDASPLAELRELGGWRDAPQDRFPAAVIDPAAQRPVTAAAPFRLDGRPIAWFSPALDAVMLDGAAFAPLRRADATTAEPGVPQVVGRATPRARRDLGDRAVLELLLRVDAIGTYRHLGAAVCLTAERETDGAYRAELRGVHHSIEPGPVRARTLEHSFAFAVEIDADDQVSVVGL